MRTAADVIGRHNNKCFWGKKVEISLVSG